MKRVYTKIGDVFCVKIDDNSKKYFQLIAYDLTQLNSDVIRAFKQIYPIDSSPALPEIINGEVEFYAHCVTSIGIKIGYWEKIGNIENVGSFERALFRSSGDDPRTKISTNWWVWRINKEQKYVGKLKGENREAEIGCVMPPDSIIYRMKTGQYDFVYPGFE